MSKLAHLLRTLRGERSADDVAFNTKPRLSRESIFRIERGSQVKLSTVKNIATELGAKEDQWIELLIAWLEFQAGADARKIHISPNSKVQCANDKPSDSSQAIILFNQLNSADRTNILFLLQHTQVIACVTPIRKILSQKPDPTQKTSHVFKLPHAHR